MIIEFTKELCQKCSETELKILKYINENKEEVLKKSIVELACATFSSPATVSRAVKKAGISGFNELRCILYKEISRDNPESTVDIINKSFLETQKVVERVSDEAVLKIVEAIKSSPRIFVFARGLTEYVADEFCFKLQLLGYNACCVKDPNIIINMARKCREEECIVVFSLNGETPELVSAAKSTKAKVIVCCCNEESTLLTYSDFCLIGYKIGGDFLSEYEVESRIPLYILSRIIIGYLCK